MVPRNCGYARLRLADLFFQHFSDQSSPEVEASKAGCVAPQVVQSSSNYDGGSWKYIGPLSWYSQIHYPFFEASGADFLTEGLKVGNRCRGGVASPAQHAIQDRTSSAGQYGGSDFRVGTNRGVR